MCGATENVPRYPALAGKRYKCPPALPLGLGYLTASAEAGVRMLSAPSMPWRWLAAATVAPKWEQGTVSAGNVLALLPALAPLCRTGAACRGLAAGGCVGELGAAVKGR